MPRALDKPGMNERQCLSSRLQFHRRELVRTLEGEVRFRARQLRVETGGIGKPEPLKHSLAGYWSRWITDEHRLAYQVAPDSIVVVSCEYHN